MQQVSVGDVDNLQEACDILSVGIGVAKEIYEGDLSELTGLAQQVEEDLADSQTMFTAACEQVSSRQQKVDALNSELESALNSLADAKSDLSQAESDLAEKESEGEYDEDGRWCPADTSAEEAAVAAAEVRVAACESEVEELTAELRAAEEELKRALDVRRKCEERLDVATANNARLQNQAEQFRALQQRYISGMEQRVSTINARLAHAKGALDEYLAANPSAADFHAWAHWNLGENQVVSPQQIHDRLSLSPDLQKQFAEYLYRRDPEFRAKVDLYRARYQSARGEAERNAVLIQASRNGSGDFAERLVKTAFAPLGEVSTQGRTYFEDGRFTKTDLLVTNLSHPVVLGKGEGMFAPVGGSLAIEVKTGHASYIYNQKDHMVFQAGGHKSASASLSICSKDVHDLPEEKERELRDALRAAGSPLIGMLPSKDEIDGTLWALIKNGSEE